MILDREDVRLLLLNVLIKNGYDISCVNYGNLLRIQKTNIFIDDKGDFSVKVKDMYENEDTYLIIQIKHKETLEKTFVKFTGYVDSWEDEINWSYSFEIVKPVNKLVWVKGE